MQNLKIVNVQVNDSSSIDVTFTENLTPSLIVSNVSIISETPNVATSEVLEIKVTGAILSITCQPLTPFAAYTLLFASTEDSPFTSLNADAKIFEDGISNRFLILGPLESDNPVRNYLDSFFRDNIYNNDDSNTVVSKYLDGLSTILSKGLYDIRQVVNENYLSNIIIDEKKTRGTGPYDRLNEEAAYEIIRVGLGPSASNASNTFQITDFPSFPISLQKEVVNETLTAATKDEVGKFNINSLILNLNAFPVSKVTSVVFTFNSINLELNVNNTYVYDITTLGYQILDSRYDQDYAFTYNQLTNNQIKLSDKALDDASFELDNILKIDVVYEFRDLGIVVSTPSVNVYTTKSSFREVIPPIINIFTLKHAPITDSNNEIPILDGIVFVDPNSIIPGAKHPAFLYELPFRLNALPASIGQYSIDYATGTVYVYGADTSNDGTGPTPPLLSYLYRFTYTSELDYVYDDTTSDIVALPTGNLVTGNGNINFTYEKVLVPNVDYVAELHIEALQERIANRLVALNAIKSLNSPITNVFRIYNETSGEIYTLDRWNDDKIYFRYNNPPTIKNLVGERATFKIVSNDLLFVNTTIGSSIFKILLNDNKIIASTEDGIGSFTNSSMTFSNNNIFKSEKWFNNEFAESANLAKLTAVGDYIVDYTNGVVYVYVYDINNFAIGTTSYKANVIVPQFPHLISVDDIYNRISTLQPKNKQFNYTSFDDGIIVPTGLTTVDESFYNDAAYEVLNNKVGFFNESTFISKTLNQIKFVRGIFEFTDLSNSAVPLNFASQSTHTQYEITLNPIVNSLSAIVSNNQSMQKIVSIDLVIPYISNNISYNFTATRVSDGYAFDATLQASVDNTTPATLLLSNTNSPAAGDMVNINYTISINQLSRVVLDYNKGDFFIDYTYLADEIIISYEYGENNIDFRGNKNLSPGTQYYTSYKVGALRDALLKNFGTLVNVTELASFDIELNRERYRDALDAALTSFIQGPTVKALKNIGKKISHIEPQIIEDAFQNWSLGSSTLSPKEITTTGAFQLLPAKFGQGVFVESEPQTIKFPINSNVRLEEGTFETWILPQWNGLDNNAVLTFNILRNGSPVESNFVFLGGGEYHPDAINGVFSLTKDNNVSGVPNKNKDGIFIYYSADGYEDYDKWHLEVIDGYTDGYSMSDSYKITISSTGNFYNFTNANISPPTNVTTFTRLHSVTLNIAGGASIDLSWTFLSDLEHYLLDLGEHKNRNRLSIYKDASGYLNFRIFDRDSLSYNISYNISSWQANQLHHVAASWKLNSRDNMDEMHFLIDGFEVPNIIRYGQKPKPYPQEPFRTVNPEEFIGSTSYPIISGDDLSTFAGSSVGSISDSLVALNLIPGSNLYVDEPGFGTASYIVSAVNGNQFTVLTPFPVTITNGKYSFNRASYTVSSDIDVSSNFIVTVSTNGIETELQGMRAVTPDYSISKDIDFNNILTISNGVPVDSLIYVRTLGLNHRKIKKQYYVWGDNQESILMTRLPPPISLDEAKVTKILLPTTIINTANSTVLSGVFHSNNFTTSQPSNSQAGRTLSAVISGTNVDFIIPVEVNIDGYVYDGYTPFAVPASETLSFTNYGVQDSVNKYVSINFVNVVARPVNASKGVVNVEIREKYSMIHQEASALVPVIKYSYQLASGNALQTTDGFKVTDNTAVFSDLFINNTLLIKSPFNVAGYYKITGVSSDRKSLFIAPLVSFDLPLDAFTDGEYQIFNVTTYRSGLQNGFFIFEDKDIAGKPYLLSHGFYELEYSTYTDINIDALNSNVYLGSDLFGRNQFNGVIDQVKIYSTMLTDTRVGETIPSNQRSVTKDFNSLKALKKDATTLMLIDFETFPFVNTSDYYVNSTSIKDHFQSIDTVNENFDNSVVILNEPIILANDGILNNKEGTIEFWTSPIFDTGNDPNVKYYFDAYGAIIEEAVSNNYNSVKLSGSAGKVLSVKLQGGDPRIDYFAGGRIEIDTQNAMVESSISLTTGSVMVSRPILQVISVKIVGDLSEVDYFAGGSVSSNKKTIYLGKALPSSSLQLLITYQTTDNNNTTLNTQVIKLNRKLPYQNAKVIVTYIPKGLQGDRLSILKDSFGNLVFSVKASGEEYSITAPTFWAKNTWHRVKASYKFNSGLSVDEIRLFIDGFEYSSTGMNTFIVGQGTQDGYNFNENIKFKDPINTLFIGSDYAKNNPAFSLMDNFRISDVFRPIYSPYGEPIDVNYSSNLNVVFPVTEDLFTTYLMNFDKAVVLNTDFAIIKNRESGLFDFSINIIDSFDIVNSSSKVQQILEKLIKVLKPANSRVFIEYIR